MPIDKKFGWEIIDEGALRGRWWSISEGHEEREREGIRSIGLKPRLETRLPINNVHSPSMVW